MILSEREKSWVNKIAEGKIQNFLDFADDSEFYNLEIKRWVVEPTNQYEFKRYLYSFDAAIYKLDILNAATSLDDLRSPPGNRLEALRRGYKGYHSIPPKESLGRINAQWRIVFRWQDSSAFDVAIGDYH